MAAWLLLAIVASLVAVPLVSLAGVLLPSGCVRGFQKRMRARTHMRKIARRSWRTFS